MSRHTLYAYVGGSERQKESESRHFVVKRNGGVPWAEWSPILTAEGLTARRQHRAACDLGLGLSKGVLEL
jgi:hypothetical protein